MTPNPDRRQEDPRWYAVYTKHQHEKKSADLLTRKGMDVFLPLYRAVHQWKDRKKALSLPLFPGYLFLRSTLENKVEILSTPGVFFLVENAGHACAIPDDEIEAVRMIAQSNTQFEPHPYLKSGEHVRIRSGPLAGIRGIFVKPKNKYRMVVSVELLRKAVSIEIDAANVEKMDGAANGESAVADTPGSKTVRESHGESPARQYRERAANQ